MEVYMVLIARIAEQNISWERAAVILLVIAVLAALCGALYFLRKRLRGFPYEKIDCLLTEREAKFYALLDPIAEECGFRVMVKVRLADLIRVKQGRKDFQSWFNRIKAKHIDFAVCSAKLEPVVLIELDDRSHDQKDRIRRDQFVDRALAKAGVPILHYREYSPEQLQKDLQNFL
ncbi:MAG TPA: DUF2726 domain-containing protein [Firmicutes bacterium]|nr:DUF2726 domain-containing protein [Bacillota bacterium]